MKIIKFNELRMMDPDELLEKYSVMICPDSLYHDSCNGKLSWHIYYLHKTTKSNKEGLDYDDTVYTDYWQYPLYSEGFSTGRYSESYVLDFNSYLEAIAYLRNKEFTIRKFESVNEKKEVPLDN